MAIASDHRAAGSDELGTDAASKPVTILVYSSAPAIRAKVISALGHRLSSGVELEYVECGLGEDAVHLLDEGGIGLAILDGEAAPVGGMGLCRQLKDELDAPPPVLLLVGRRDDAWLATWSRAEAVVAHPIDAVRIAAAVTSLLAGDVDAVAAAH